MRFRRQYALLVICGFVAGCGVTSTTQAPATSTDAGIARLFDPATVLTDAWEHILLKGGTDYQMAIFDNRLAIRAYGRHSASMLARRVSLDPTRCQAFSWSWSATTLQQSADLTLKSREDVAASVFVLFGDPGFLFDPKPVPTIRYVWTNTRALHESIIDNPYLPEFVKSIVLRNGPQQSGSWVTETRSLAEDYALAFKGARPPAVHAIALFTDNDQTGEAVEAFYGVGTVRCSS